MLGELGPVTTIGKSDRSLLSTTRRRISNSRKSHEGLNKERKTECRRGTFGPLVSQDGYNLYSVDCELPRKGTTGSSVSEPTLRSEDRGSGRKRCGIRYDRPKPVGKLSDRVRG